MPLDHTHARFKPAGVETNNILKQRNILFKPEHRAHVVDDGSVNRVPFSVYARTGNIVKDVVGDGEVATTALTINAQPLVVSHIVR
jgi:hypothetical protein